MNVLISVNRAYFDKAKTMLYSLADHTEEPITVYLLNKHLDESLILDLKRFAQRISVTLKVLTFCFDYFDDMPVNKQLSMETYFRLFAHVLLPDDVDRILWLDADIIVRHDLNAFYHQSFDGQCLIAVRDINYQSEQIIALKKDLSIAGEHDYFNAGVLLMNIAIIRDSIQKEDIIGICLRLRDKLQFYDQDILNYLYQNRVKYADIYYNYQLTHVYTMDCSDIADAHIIHYSGLIKPWDIAGHNRTSKYYWQVILKRRKYISALAHYSVLPLYHIYSRLRIFCRKFRGR